MLTQHGMAKICPALLRMTEAHEFLAEPLAEGPNAPCFSAGVRAQRFMDPVQKSSIAEKETRYVAPTTSLSDLFEISKGFLDCADVSYRTFVRAYHLHWSKVIKWRGQGQHAKCNACEKFRGYARQCSSASDKALVKQAYKEHLAIMMRDRAADAKWRELARSSVNTGLAGTDDATSWLVMVVDGMDMAKFKLPRNVNHSKDWEKMYRPEVKCSLVALLLQT